MTVTWHPQAEDDTAELYLQAVNRPQFQQAVNEADRLLAVKPEAKGRHLFAGQLDPQMIDLLKARIGVIPESIRRLRLGPIDAYFVVDPPNCMVRVLHVRFRT